MKLALVLGAAALLAAPAASAKSCARVDAPRTATVGERVRIVLTTLHPALAPDGTPRLEPYDDPIVAMSAWLVPARGRPLLVSFRRGFADRSRWYARVTFPRAGVWRIRPTAGTACSGEARVLVRRARS